MKCKLYIATTYFVYQDQLSDPCLTAIGDDLDDVMRFLKGVRHLPVVSDPSEIVFTNKDGAIAMVEAAEFYNEANRDSFINHESREPFILQPFGKVDRHFTNLSKKESKDVMLPAILIDAIEQRAEEFLSELTMAQHSLKELLLYMNGYDRSQLKLNPDSICIMRICKMIDKMQENKGYEIQNEIYERSPLLFCDEHEYRHNLQIALYHQNMKRMYRESVSDPES